MVQKVREECKVNCTCDIAYIWEQNHIIHSKNSVNCSNKGFTDFPDPDKLPHPTDTLDLSNNQVKTFEILSSTFNAHNVQFYTKLHYHEVHVIVNIIYTRHGCHLRESEISNNLK